MTRLSDLAAAISPASPKIRAFAVETAAEVDALAMRVAKLETATPPPPPPGPWVVAPPQAPITTVQGAAGIGLNIGAGAELTYRDYVIDDTGDSAVIVEAVGPAGVTLERLRLTNVAKRAAVSWGKHGVYAKNRDITIRDLYASNGGYAADGVSAREPGLLVERFECWGFSFPVAYFDEGQPAGKPLVFRHGKGDTKLDTAVWVDINQTHATMVLQSFEFEDVHFTGPATAAFLRCEAGKFAGQYVKLTGCTMNGRAVTAANVAGIPADKLVIG